jgi:Highly conserved protein containing a thioredoxin domain
MTKRKLLALVCCLITVLVMRAQEPGIRFEENKTWKELLQMAGKQNKLIFLDCYTSWCGPCKAMAKDVFPLPEVGAFMNKHFINVKFDMEKGEGIDLYKQYKPFIPGFPTYLLINSKGQVVHQVAGYNAADKFLAKMQNGLEERSWIAYSNKYEEGRRDWPFVQSYLQLLEDAFQKATVKKVTAEVLPLLTLDVISNDSAAYRVFRKYWTDAESPLLWSFLSNPGIYRKFRDPERDVNEWGGRLFKRAVDSYTKNCVDSPALYDVAKAKLLIENLRKLHVSGRENSITLMLLSLAVMENDGPRFVQLYQSAANFGLLRYDNAFIGKAARHFAAQTNDKALLQQYLSCISIDLNDRFISTDDLRNSAFILEKIGEQGKAKKYYALANKKEEELKKQLESFKQ